MNNAVLALVASLGGGVVASIAPVMSSVLDYRNRRRQHEFNVEIHRQDQEERERAEKSRTYDECLQSAGEFIGQVDRAQRGDRNAFITAREARGRMISAWTRYLRYGSDAEKGIIRHFLSSVSQPLENGELYEAACSAVIQLADIANPDYGRQAVVVPTKTSLLVISPSGDS